LGRDPPSQPIEGTNHYTIVVAPEAVDRIIEAIDVESALVSLPS
jgi:hypothetical protein